MTEHNIITIIEETEGWEGWKDVTILWPTGDVQVCTLLDWQLWNDENNSLNEGEIVIPHFSREAVIDWAIEFARNKWFVNCNVVIGTFAN